MLRSPWMPRVVLGAAVAGLLALIVLIAVGEQDPDQVRLTGGGETQRIYAGIEQDGAYLGPGDASLTITIFNDLHAPTGAEYHLRVVNGLAEDYARTGRARIELRHYSFTGLPTSLAAHGAVAAGEQGYQWQYTDLFFRNQDEAPQGRVDEVFLRNIANGVPELEARQWASDFESEAVADRVLADGELATELRLPAAPAVLVAGPGGSRQLEDEPTRAEIDAAVASLE